MAFAKSLRVSKNRLPSLGQAVGFSALLLVCITTGLAVAVLPAGFLIRLLLLPVGFGFLLLCWMLRRKGVGLPGTLSLLVLLGAVFMSVLWPRYIFFSLGGPHVNPQTLSVLASLGVIAFWFAYSPEFSAKFRRVLFDASGVGALAVVWLSWRLLASAAGEFPLASVIEYVRDIFYVSSFLLIGCSLATYDDGPKWLLRVVVGAGFIAALAGLIEAFMQKNYFVQFASGGDSQAVADALKTIMLDKTRDGSYRVQSTFEHPIAFAQFIAAIIPLGTYFAFYEKRTFWRIVGFLVVPIGFVAIVKSGSRAGLVSVAVAFAFIMAFFWLRGMVSKGIKRGVAIIAMPVFLVGVGLVYFVVRELVIGRSSLEAGSSSVRLKMLQDSITALTDSPVWGFGHGMAVSKAGVVSGYTGVATLDSHLLNIALDSGYVGLTLFLAIICLFAVKGGLAATRLPGSDGAQVGMIVAGVLALVATFVGLSIPSNMTLLWLFIAAALPLINSVQAPKSKLVGARLHAT